MRLLRAAERGVEDPLQLDVGHEGRRAREQGAILRAADPAADDRAGAHTRGSSLPNSQSNMNGTQSVQAS